MHPGERIDDRYLLEARVGAGSMGVVFRARDLAEERLVALKIVQVADARQRLRFEREAAVLAELRHEAIAQYHGHGTIGARARYLVMEWIEGPTLRARLQRGPLSLDETLRLAARLAEALGAAHAAGIVHRDVKPANIMLVGDQVGAAKLLDFGVARRARLGEATLTETGVFMGTLRYMAPEQARDAKKVDASADVYSLGAVLFECLSGRPAIAEEEPVRVLAKIVLEPTPRLREARPETSPAIDGLVAAMMAKNPGERPADGTALRALIDDAASRSSGDGIASSGISGSERRLSWVMLVADAQLATSGEQWRDHVHTPDDIWEEVRVAAKLPGVTDAPRLQPIAARLVMLQSGMRAPMGLKIRGPDLQTIEATGLEIERILKEVASIRPETVVADRIVGAPYLEIDIDRSAIARHGISVVDLQDVIQTAIGGRVLTRTVEGRERYPVRVRYMRERRDTPDTFERVLVPSPLGHQIPLGQLARIRYARGPQMIKSEDTFLTGYVLFDKHPGHAEVDAVEEAQARLREKI